jgi:hypothetical protein
MNAGELSKLLRNQKMFGGIYYLKDLENIVISKVPLSIIVHAEDHWIALYLGKKSVEIMDSLGFCNFVSNNIFVNFICRQIQTKTFQITPKLQNNSDICGIYCAIFLKLKENGCSFDEILNLFPGNFKGNDKIARRKFKNLFTNA